tara:strand:+ start:594 stop:704 length:111 start_codon:yes stop_codon:yes gene_type:complete
MLLFLVSRSEAATTSTSLAAGGWRSCRPFMKSSSTD